MRFAVLAAVAAALIFGGSAEAATIEILPGASNVSISDTFTLDVIVTDADDLFSFQADISFDPTILQANSVTEGPFLPSGGATFFIPGLIDNTLGSIPFTADSLIGAIAGVNGSGTLFSIEFEAIAPGTANISISNEILLDSQFGTIDVTPAGGSVDVSDGNSTVIPEPSSVVFLATGLGALGVLARRRQSAGS